LDTAQFQCMGSYLPQSATPWSRGQA